MSDRIVRAGGRSSWSSAVSSAAGDRCPSDGGFLIAPPQRPRTRLSRARIGVHRAVAAGEQRVAEGLSELVAALVASADPSRAPWR